MMGRAVGSRAWSSSRKSSLQIGQGAIFPQHSRSRQRRSASVAPARRFQFCAIRTVEFEPLEWPRSSTLLIADGARGACVARKRMVSRFRVRARLGACTLRDNVRASVADMNSQYTRAGVSCWGAIVPVRGVGGRCTRPIRWARVSSGRCSTAGSTRTHEYILPHLRHLHETCLV
eukprot:1186018-Prorocentrum_minimum.AAC.2